MGCGSVFAAVPARTSKIDAQPNATSRKIRARSRNRVIMRSPSLRQRYPPDTLPAFHFCKHAPITPSADCPSIDRIIRRDCRRDAEADFFDRASNGQAVGSGGEQVERDFPLRGLQVFAAHLRPEADRPGRRDGELAGWRVIGAGDGIAECVGRGRRLGVDQDRDPCLLRQWRPDSQANLSFERRGEFRIGMPGQLDPRRRLVLGQDRIEKRRRVDRDGAVGSMLEGKSRIGAGGNAGAVQHRLKWGKAAGQ